MLPHIYNRQLPSVLSDVGLTPPLLLALGAGGPFFPCMFQSVGGLTLENSPLPAFSECAHGLLWPALKWRCDSVPSCSCSLKNPF